MKQTSFNKLKALAVTSHMSVKEKKYQVPFAKMVICTNKTSNVKNKTLHLILRAEWFNLIASDEKKEEYRDISPFWINRLTVEGMKFKKFDTVTFQHGYKKNAPRVVVECKGIEIKTPKKKWSGNTDCLKFAIKLGGIIDGKI